MASRSYRLPSSYDRPPLRRRASGLALALGINLLLLFVLLGIGAFRPEPRKPGSRSLVIDLVPESHETAAPQPKAAATPPTPPKLPPRPPRIVPVVPPIPTEHPLDMIEISPEEYAASDIAKLPKAGDGGGSGSAGDSQAVGRGPHGEILYAAEWARHPTDAELGGYLPRNAPDGWGVIACKTLPGNRVDDCIELENYPSGSHLASAVRQAAWQFRVRPPRKNGRDLIGEWVSIRIDYEHLGSN